MVQWAMVFAAATALTSFGPLPPLLSVLFSNVSVMMFLSTQQDRLLLCSTVFRRRKSWKSFWTPEQHVLQKGGVCSVRSPCEET